LNRQTADRIFRLTIGAFAVYAAAFIWRSSFVIGGTRTFCLFDDAMVSMRYARNLASGFGLVWNPGGERVEGFTNPGWTLVMALLHLLPLSSAKISLAVQAVSALCLIANLFVVRRIGQRLAGSGFAELAVLFTAFYYPLNNWALQGMEVGVLALIVSLGCLNAIEPAKQGGNMARVYLPLAAGLLVRPDMLVPFLVLWGVMVLCNPGSRRIHMAWGTASLLLCMGGLTAFRLAYYGDTAPNTWYLKMTGFPALLRMSRGAIHTGYFLFKILWPVALAGIVFVACFSRRRRARPPASHPLRLFAAPLFDPAPLTLAAVIVAQCAYAVYVGGDAWERIAGANRYLSIVLPCLFVLVSLVLAHVHSLVRNDARFVRWLAPATAALFFVAANSFYGPQSLLNLLLVEPPLYKDDNIRNVKLALALREFTTPDARVAIDYAGVPAYFADRQMIDLLGKNDRHVAQTPAHRGMLRGSPLLEFYPGHIKWDYGYSITSKRADVVCAIWRRAAGDSRAHLRGAFLEGDIGGVSVYLRKGSPRVKWDKVPFTPVEPAR
jgi:hypothetical protein